MQVIHSPSDLRRTVLQERARGASIGLAPTMGALHEGHGSLITTAAGETDCVVVSVFVNPIQFDRAEDFQRYPRTLETDAGFCAERGAKIVWAPSAEDMYPLPQLAFVEVMRVTDKLCGEFRPGHFRGVATVVLKLLNIAQPDKAYFGEKDAQQLAVIRRMVSDLNVPVEIREVATVREADGLAMSSRNQLLTPDQRRIAPVLHQALCAAALEVSRGTDDPAAVKAIAMAILTGREVRTEYFEIVDPEGMQPVDRILAPVRIAAAIWLGPVRLIDNVLCPRLR